jgi:hypothetical protein
VTAPFLILVLATIALSMIGAVAVPFLLLLIIAWRGSRETRLTPWLVGGVFAGAAGGAALAQTMAG